MLNLNGVDTSSPPKFTTINEKGETVKWWLCPTLTSWAHHAGCNRKSLPSVHGWVVDISDNLEYVITENNMAVFSSKSLEEALVHIDIIRANEGFQ